MVIDASDAYRYPDVNMEAVTCPLNAFAIRAGMVYSVRSVSIWFLRLVALFSCNPCLPLWLMSSENNNFNG